MQRMRATSLTMEGLPQEQEMQGCYRYKGESPAQKHRHEAKSLAAAISFNIEITSAPWASWQPYPDSSEAEVRGSCGRLRHALCLLSLLFDIPAYIFQCSKQRHAGAANHRCGPDRSR